ASTSLKAPSYTALNRVSHSDWAMAPVQRTMLLQMAERYLAGKALASLSPPLPPQAGSNASIRARMRPRDRGLVRRVFIWGALFYVIASSGGKRKRTTSDSDRASDG